jgi:hypothetical protein
MPVLCISAFAQSASHAVSYTHEVSVEPRVCVALATVMRGYEGRLTPERIALVRSLYGADFFPGDLAFLVEMVEREGGAYLSFLPDPASKRPRRPSYRTLLPAAPSDSGREL